MSFKSETASSLTITVYVFIAGVKFLLENFPELFKRHVADGKGGCVCCNRMMQTHIGCKRFLHLRTFPFFCLVGSFFHFLKFTLQKYVFSILS